MPASYLHRACIVPAAAASPRIVSLSPTIAILASRSTSTTSAMRRPGGLGICCPAASKGSINGVLHEIMDRAPFQILHPSASLGPPYHDLLPHQLRTLLAADLEKRLLALRAFVIQSILSLSFRPSSVLTTSTAKARYWHNL